MTSRTIHLHITPEEQYEMVSLLAEDLYAAGDATDMTRLLFRNYYQCPHCDFEWEDVWSMAVNDDCPNCQTPDVEPYHSEDEDHENETT